MKVSFKPDVARANGVLHEIEPRADQLSAHAGEAQNVLAAWGSRARRFTRNNPGAVLLGAVALGFLLARAARRA
jgi:hypothetical protein